MKQLKVVGYKKQYYWSSRKTKIGIWEDDVGGVLVAVACRSFGLCLSAISENIEELRQDFNDALEILTFRFPDKTARKWLRKIIQTNYKQL